MSATQNKGQTHNVLHELALWSPTVIAFFFLVDKASWFWSNSPEMQFGWMIPVLSGYLLWERWYERSTLVARWDWLSIALVLCGSFFLFTTQIYQAAYGLTASSMSGLGLGFLAISFANVRYLYGTAGLKSFGFGLLFLMIAVPIPPVIYQAVVGSLQDLVAQITVEVLALVGIPARLQGSLVQLPTGVVGVDEACSGIRSLQSTLMATLFIGNLTLRWVPTQVMLLISGIAIAVLGNLIRVFALSYSASKSGLSAVDQFHDTAGWSILIFTVVGVALVSVVFGKFEQLVASSDTPEGGGSTNLEVRNPKET